MDAKAFLTRVGHLAALGAVMLTATEARAALTDSEKGQVRSYVAAADPSSVSNLRALVARPDLSETEVREALSSALRLARFDERTESYVRALVFGAASQSSRSTVAPAVVHGLLARADTLLRGQPGNPNQWSGEARDELLRLHRFIARMTSDARDSERRGVASLEARALHSMAMAYRDHLALHSAFIAFRTRAEGAALLLRLQVALALVKTTAGEATREQVADWLGMGMAARGLFVRTGVLIDDGGMGPEVRLSEVVRTLESVPGALEGVSIVLVSKTPPGSLGVGDELLAVRTPLGPVAPKREGFWPESVSPAAPEQALVETAFAASLRAAKRATKRDGALAEQVQAAMARAAGKGSFGHLAQWIVDSSLDRDAATSTRPVSPELLLAATMTMLLLDAERTTELAAMRSLAGRTEPLEQLELGLRALCVVSSAGDTGEAKLGRTVDGGVQPMPAAVALDGGRVKSFRLGSHDYAFAHDQAGKIEGLRRDGKQIRLMDLATVRVPGTAGDRWQAGSRTMVRLSGTPRVGVVGESQFVMDALGSDGAGFDAVYTEAPAVDQSVEAVVQLDGDGMAGQIVRATTGDASFRGVALVLRCDGACYARLASFDGKGQERELARETRISDLPPADGVRIRLSIHGQEVTAKVATRQLRGRLAQPLPSGHVGWVVRHGSRVVVRDWVIEASK